MTRFATIPGLLKSGRFCPSTGKEDTSGGTKGRPFEGSSEDPIRCRQKGVKITPFWECKKHPFLRVKKCTFLVSKSEPLSDPFVRPSELEQRFLQARIIIILRAWKPDLRLPKHLSKTSSKGSSFPCLHSSKQYASFFPCLPDQLRYVGLCTTPFIPRTPALAWCHSY